MPTTYPPLGQYCHSPHEPQLAFTNGIRPEATTCCKAQGKGLRRDRQGSVTELSHIDFLLLKPFPRRAYTRFGWSFLDYLVLNWIYDFLNFKNPHAYNLCILYLFLRIILNAECWSMFIVYLLFVYWIILLRHYELEVSNLLLTNFV